jgi:hypothetical protein
LRSTRFPDRPLHADFLRLSADHAVHVNVPVVFANEEKSPGLKKGGVLNVVRHELELVCAPDSIPDDIVVDVTGFEVGDSIHISSVTLPAGVKTAITDRDFTIATIVAPPRSRAKKAIRPRPKPDLQAAFPPSLYQEADGGTGKNPFRPRGRGSFAWRLFSCRLA